MTLKTKEIKQDNPKRYRVLIEGGFQPMFQEKDVIQLIKDTYSTIGRPSDALMFFYDRPEDMDGIFTVARLEVNSTEPNSTIDIRKRADHDCPNPAELAVFDTWREISTGGMELVDPQNMDDVTYDASDEKERKDKALAGQKHNMTYEEADHAVDKSNIFLRCISYNTHILRL